MDEDRIRAEKNNEIARLKVTPLLMSKRRTWRSKKDWGMLAVEGTDMRSLFYDIHRTASNAVERSEYSILSALRILRISRSWYYSQISFSPLLDGRFNPMVIRNDD